MEIINIYYTQTVQFFKKRILYYKCTLLVFFCFCFLLFNDVDIPQVALACIFCTCAKR